MVDIIYWLWLTGLKGIGSVKILKLLEVLDNPENIWRAGQTELQSLKGIRKNDIDQLLNKNLDDAKKALYNINKMGIEVLTIDNPEYPLLLKNIYDPPALLYFKGKFPKKDKISIAVVGARRSTHYGKTIAEKIASQLAERGIYIISGMARGIDTAAHKGALKSGGKTVAVLGCGVDRVYPKENEELMKYIMKNGAVISEYPPGTFPNPTNFPARNRIISGMSQGILVVEAGEKSGSLITVDFALEQGRDVFAIPGNIDNYYSMGTNSLIKQGAKIVTCIEDILEELPIERNIISKPKDELGIYSSIELQLSENEKKVFDNLSSTPLHIDELCRNCGYNIQMLNSTLVLLEMKGLIQQIPGKYFAIKG